MPDTYLPRHIDEVLSSQLKDLPAVVIDGPRASGKTMSATRIASTSLYLDNKIQADTILGSPDLLHTLPTPILLDEWEQAPEIWDLTRREVDQDFTPGRFIITGSAFPKSDTRTHSGAGRFLHLRLRPMTLSERQIAEPIITLDDLLFHPPATLFGESDITKEEYFTHLCSSGLPQLFRLPLKRAQQLLDGYIQDMLQSDLESTGYRIASPANLRSWLMAYSAATATDANYNELLDRATIDLPNKPSRNTVNRYRDLLERIWILDPLEPWVYPHKLGRQKVSPLHHLCDPALAARLLRLSPEDLLHPKNGLIAGRLFESLATLCLRSYAELHGWTVGHFRQRDGRREVDLVVQADASHIVAIEVKASSRISDADTNHLHWFKQQIGEACRSMVILYSGRHAYRRPDGVLVIPLALLK